MATPQVWLEVVEDEHDRAQVAVLCECGATIPVGVRPPLLMVLNLIGEHNYEKHLRPDNVGLRVRRP